jgi:hypothetical protein
MIVQRSLESYVIDSVKDQELPRDIPGLPLTPELLNSLLSNIPAVLADPAQEQPSLPYNDTTPDIDPESLIFTLKQPSSSHKRSFELTSHGARNPWSDEYGNQYGAMTIKGNNFSNPGIHEHPTASEGYIAWGLQESAIIERVLRASDIMRQRGISTEYIVGLSEPQSYPWPTIEPGVDATENIPLREYKRRLIDNYWKALPDNERSAEDLADLYEKFETMTFYNSVRATDTAYRLSDLMFSADVRQEVFELINKEYLPDHSAPLDPTTKDGQIRYLNEYFVPSVARNLARLHPGLAHGFANSLNLTALGGIVDLDSVHGEPIGLGDEPATPFEQAMDVIGVLEAISKATVNCLADSEQAQTSLRLFVTEYMREAVTRFDNKNEAVKTLGSLVVQFCNEAETMYRNSPQAFLSSLSGAKSFWTNAPEFMQDTYDAYVLDGDQPAVDKIDQLALQAHIAEAFRDPEIERRMRNVLLHDIAVHADCAVTECLNELNGDDDFNVADFMLDNLTGQGSYFAKTVVDYYRNDCLAELTTFLATHSTFREASSKDDIEYLRYVIMSVSSRYRAEIHAASRDMFLRLLPTIKNEFNKATAYERPARLIEGTSSYMQTGLNEKQFFHHTDEVPLQAVKTAAAEQGFEIKPIALEKITTRITLSQMTENGIITEILSNATFGGTSYPIGSSDVKIEVDYETVPEYIAVVERVTSGETKIYLYTSSDIEQRAAIEDKHTSTDAQLTLFS